jgi:uncharacterized protein
VRVVLDTNVLISAALKPEGLEAAVVTLVFAGVLEAWVTAEVWAEYEEVLARPKFEKVREASRHILRTLDPQVRRTTAGAVSTDAFDEDDNRFVECALAARAEFLVTGNLRHYPAGCGVTRMVNARGLLEILELGK